MPQSRDIGPLLTLDSLWERNYARSDTASAAKLMSEDFFMLSANGATKETHTIRSCFGDWW